MPEIDFGTVIEIALGILLAGALSIVAVGALWVLAMAGIAIVDVSTWFIWRSWAKPWMLVAVVVLLFVLVMLAVRACAA